jgi:hypothetical protein
VADLRSYSLALISPPMAGAALKYRFKAKPTRIPRAYGKAYGPEELRTLRQ